MEAIKNFDLRTVLRVHKLKQHTHKAEPESSHGLPRLKAKSLSLDKSHILPIPVYAQVLNFIAKFTSRFSTLKYYM